MAKVKAGLRGLSPLGKQNRAAIVHGRMNGNPNFPSPSPSMLEFHAAYIELKAANLAALDRGRMAIARRDRAVKRIDNYLTRLAGYVNSECLGDTLKLMGSGFPLVKEAVPISSLPQPLGLQARPTAYPGQVKLRWNRVPGTLVYQVERALQAPEETDNWVFVSLTSRPQLIVEGLPSYEPQRFRICAVGTKDNKSPYSAVAFGKAA